VENALVGVEERPDKAQNCSQTSYEFLLIGVRVAVAVGMEKMIAVERK
jgi:hypothetical protein